MDELKIKFIYNGEKNFFNFLKMIRYDLGKNSFDKNVWSGTVKIKDRIFTEKEKDFSNILFKIFFILGEETDVLIEINLWNKINELKRVSS